MTSNFERPFTPRTRLGEPSKFVKTRFRRFATFYFSAPKIFFREIFVIGKTVFHQFAQVFEEQRPNGHQNQLPRQILLQIDLSWGLYGRKSSEIGHRTMIIDHDHMVIWSYGHIIIRSYDDKKFVDFSVAYCAHHLVRAKIRRLLCTPKTACTHFWSVRRLFRVLV